MIYFFLGGDVNVNYGADSPTVSVADDEKGNWEKGLVDSTLTPTPAYHFSGYRN